MQKITAQFVRKGLHLPANLQAPYQKVVIAGMRIMFSPETRSDVTQVLQAPGAIPDKIAKGVVLILVTLFNQSNKSLPPQVLIPAGMELCVHAGEFLEKAGMEVSDAEMSQAMSQMAELLMKQFGLDPQKFMSTVQQRAAKGAPQAAAVGGA